MQAACVHHESESNILAIPRDIGVKVDLRAIADRQLASTSKSILTWFACDSEGVELLEMRKK